MNKFDRISSTLLAIIVASSTFAARGQAAPTASNKAQAQIAMAEPANLKGITDSNSAGWHAREGSYYKREWGIDIVDVRRVASGEMLAFRYIVLDPEKAKVLNDKRSAASLVDEKTGAKLLVPQMEKVGALRTTVTAAKGRMYWLIFANTGRVVTDGSRVDVNIGDFHAQGLTVISK
jgi:hypothetical protein